MDQILQHLPAFQTYLWQMLTSTLKVETKGHHRKSMSFNFLFECTKCISFKEVGTEIGLCGIEGVHAISQFVSPPYSIQCTARLWILRYGCGSVFKSLLLPSASSLTLGIEAVMFLILRSQTDFCVYLLSLGKQKLVCYCYCIAEVK